MGKETEEEKRQGLQKRRLSAKLGSKMNDDENDEALSAEEMTRFRRIAARANFLAQDKMDIAYATKEATRRMTAPTTEDWNKLVRLGRYLARYPRVGTSTRTGPQTQTGPGAEGQKDQRLEDASTVGSICSSSGARRRQWWP